MCPVGDRPLVDWALDRVTPHVSALAVNARYDVARLAAHVAARGAHVSDERDHPEELGTGGAVGALRDWLDGRAVLVVNGDTWTTVDLAPLLDGWDGDRIRVLVAGRAEVSPSMPLAGALVPWRDVAGLCPVPSGLWEVSWRDAVEAGRIEAVAVPPATPFLDCGTPGAYLAANLAASGGESVIGAGAVVEGEVVRSVVWPGAVVRPGERLVEAIRAGHMTVLVR